MAALGATGGRIAGGALWMIALRMCIRGLGFVSTIILARLLVPADFGLVAMAMTVWSILDTVLDLSFATALITEPREDRKYYDTAWTLSIFKGIVVAVLLFTTAGFIADYFNEPRITAIIHVFALISLIMGFQNVGTVNFIKDLQMHRSFALGVAVKVPAFIVTVAAAVILRSYWALVLGMFAGGAATVLMSYVLCDFRPRLALAKTGELLSFSSWLMANNIINAIVSQIDAVVMGHLATARLLGIYRIALEISGLPVTEIMAPARAALLPGFVKWADDRDKLAKNYVDSLAILLAIALPIATGIAIVADPLTRTLLGDQWLEAVPIMRILLVSTVVQILCDNAYYVVNAVRKPHINVIRAGVVAPAYVVGLYFGVEYYGIYGAAFAHAGAMLLSLIANSVILRRIMRTSLLEVFRGSWRTILATAVMGLVVPQIMMAWLEPLGLNAPTELVLASLSGVAVFAAMEALLWVVFGRGTGAESRLAELLFAFAKSHPMFKGSVSS
jgi:lipopolysaccharide exporter